MSSNLTLSVEILGEFKKLTQATEGAGKELNTLSASATKISKGMNKAFAAIGVGISFAFLARELKEATVAAIEDRKSQELLANQLENTIGVTDKQVESIERQIGAMQISTNVADDKLRPSFAAFVRVTKDSTEAMKLLKLATDVSAGSGKNLEAVTMALSKAYQGKMTALTKLGIPMSDSIQNAADYSAAMTKLNKLQLEAANTTGPAHTKAMEKVAEQQDKVNAIAAAGIDWQKDLGDAFANSAEKAANLDPYQRMQIIFGEIQEKLGSALLPILDKFATWMATPKGQETLQAVADAASNILTELTNTANWAIKNKDWLLPLAGTASIFLGVAKAISGITTAITAAKVAQELFNASAYRNPYIIALGAVAGVAAYMTAVNSPEVNQETTRILKNKDPMIPQLDKYGNPAKPGSTNNVTINVNNPNATAPDIIKKLDDYYKATGTRLSQ